MQTLLQLTDDEVPLWLYRFNQGREHAEPEVRELTTNQKLAALGYTSEPSGHGQKRIFKDGVQVFEGRAHETEQWLSGPNAGDVARAGNGAAPKEKNNL